MNEDRFPLSWPAHYPRTPKAERRSSAFRVPPAQAFSDLVDEALRFGSNPVISMNAPRRTSDGRPYADALDDVISDPGAVLYLTRDGKRLSFPCDAYLTIRENLRAITLAVEAFRSLDRHGVKQLLATAMRSFTALPPPAEGPGAIMLGNGARHWSEVLGVSRQADRKEISAAYRKRAKELHEEGGFDAPLQELNVARDAALLEVLK